MTTDKGLGRSEKGCSYPIATPNRARRSALRKDFTSRP
jgi:hypothetical protein